jgi:hypothetical protein
MKYNYLVFSSVGDYTTYYERWYNKNKNYDLFICYYGDKENKYSKYSDFYVERKGSKFQNFKYFWDNDDRLQNYDYYFIVDDDITIDSININKLFEYSIKYDLWISQPSFDSSQNNSLINHKITQNIKNSTLRYTNFIEVNSMCFSKWAISECMKIYDNSLVGWGIDWLFIWHLGKDKEDKYAIIDDILCINPRVRYGTVIKEIDKLQHYRDRFLNWKRLARKYNIEEWSQKVYKIII